MAAQFATDVKKVFLNTGGARGQELEESITYVEFGKASKTIKAIVDRIEGFDDGLDQVQKVNIYVSSDATDGVVNPDFRDRVKIDGKSYKPASWGPDDYGMQLLKLVRLQPREKAAPDYRLRRFS